MVSRILVVCTGNLCRSPLAEHLLVRLAGRAGLALEVRSRGLAAAVGRSVPEGTRRAAEALGLSLERHRPSPLTAADAAWAEEALVMEPWQALELQALGPGLRVTGLWEACGLSEIPDPYGRPALAHLETGRLLERALEAWLAARFPGSARP